MKKLIISLNSYDWIIDSCISVIRKEPSKFDIMIVCKDNKNPIKICKSLCSDAIYSQRAYDLFKVGKELGIKKITNLMYNIDNLDIQKLIAQLQLYILISGVKDVYFQDISILNSIFKSVRNIIGINIYPFSGGIPSPQIKTTLVGLP